MYLVMTFVKSQKYESVESHSIALNTIEEAIEYMHDLEKDIKISYTKRGIVGQNSSLLEVYEEGDMNSGNYRKHAIYEEEEYYLHIKPVGVLVSESASFFIEGDEDEDIWF